MGFAMSRQPSGGDQDARICRRQHAELDGSILMIAVPVPSRKSGSPAISERMDRPRTIVRARQDCDSRPSHGLLIRDRAARSPRLLKNYSTTVLRPSSGLCELDESVLEGRDVAIPGGS